METWPLGWWRGHELFLHKIYRFRRGHVFPGDTDISSTTVAGNLFVRLPIGNSGFAPYIYGGAGWRDGSTIPFGTDTFTADGGVGLEYRFNPHLGLFGDVRYTWTDKNADECLARAGFRIGLIINKYAKLQTCSRALNRAPRHQMSGRSFCFAQKLNC